MMSGVIILASLSQKLATTALQLLPATELHYKSAVPKLYTSKPLSPGAWNILIWKRVENNCCKQIEKNNNFITMTHGHEK